MSHAELERLVRLAAGKLPRLSVDRKHIATSVWTVQCTPKDDPLPAIDALVCQVDDAVKAGTCTAYVPLDIPIPCDGVRIENDSVSVSGRCGWELGAGCEIVRLAVAWR